LLPGNAERGPQGFEQVIEIDDELALLGRRKMPTRSVSVLLGDVTATEDGVQLIGALGGEAHDDTPLSWEGLPKALKREVREVTADRSAHHDHAIAKIDRSEHGHKHADIGSDPVRRDQSRRAREGERDEPRLGLKSKTPPSY
jgi:hypothetical protein